MNKIELEYKRDSGMSAKIGFEAIMYENKSGYRVYNVDAAIDEHFDLSDGVIELPTAEYLKWLEEKVEQQTNNQ